MKIKDIKVFFDEDNENKDMYMSFVLESELAKNKSSDFLKKLVEQSGHIFSETDWNAIYPNIEVKMNEDRLLFKEKDIEEGRYGKPSVLITVPSLLFKWGFINSDVCQKFEEDIRCSVPYKKREEEIEGKKSSHCQCKF